MPVSRHAPAFAAVALAGLDDLPDTISSRAVIVRMRRRAPGERIESYRRRVHEADGHELRDRLAAWTGSHWHALADAWPDLPAGIEDRNADVWEPLLAIADAAGGHWPTTARVTAVTLVTSGAANGRGFGVQLLGDLRAVFDGHAFVATDEILTALHAVDESPWADIRGRALDARGLSTRLGKYGIKPKQKRIGERVVRGYERAELSDSWARYLPAVVTDETGPSSKEIPPRGMEEESRWGPRPLAPTGVTSVTPATECRVCREPMSFADAGETTHPTCELAS